MSTPLPANTGNVNVDRSPANAPRQNAVARRRDYDQTVEENELGIAAVYEAYAARSPRQTGQPIGAIYARYSTDFQSSAADQVRALLAEAERRGIHIPRDQIYADYGITGRTQFRPALDQLRVTIGGRRCSVLLVLSLSRLFRNLRACLEFIDDVIVHNNARCIVVDRNIDTGDGNQWRLSLPIHALFDEQAATTHVSSIRAAHVRLAEEGERWGSLPVGYTSTDERGEPARVRIDPAGAACIRRIFQWFVVDRLSILTITRRLNADLESPRPPLSDNQWSDDSVRRALLNRRYIGDWSYGRTERRWIRARDYGGAFPRSEPLREIQDESQRIIDDYLFLAAAARLDTNIANRGRLNSQGVRNPLTALLSGLLYCAHHARRMLRAGPNGDVYYICPDCQRLEAAERPLFSLLDGEITLDCVARELERRLQGDEELVEQVIAACIDAELRQQRPDESRLRQLESQIARLRTQIDFALRNVGDSTEDQQQSEVLLRQLRSERTAQQAELASIRVAADQTVRVPSRDEVTARIRRLAESIIAVTNQASPDEESLTLAHEILRRFVGGRILLSQQGRRVKHHGWLRGEFDCDLIGWLASESSGCARIESPPVRIAVDFRRASEDPISQGKFSNFAVKKCLSRRLRRTWALGAIVCLRCFTSTHLH